MGRRNYAEHARVTAICVNLALDQVEADIRGELERANDLQVDLLQRILRKLKDRRVAGNDLEAVGTA